MPSALRFHENDPTSKLGYDIGRSLSSRFRPKRAVQGAGFRVQESLTLVAFFGPVLGWLFIHRISRL
jgi:hypothetical protein